LIDSIQFRMDFIGLLKSTLGHAKSTIAVTDGRIFTFYIIVAITVAIIIVEVFLIFVIEVLIIVIVLVVVLVVVIGLSDRLMDVRGLYCFSLCTRICLCRFDT